MEPGSQASRPIWKTILYALVVAVGLSVVLLAAGIGVSDDGELAIGSVVVLAAMVAIGGGLVVQGIRGLL